MGVGEGGTEARLQVAPGVGAGEDVGEVVDEDFGAVGVVASVFGDADDGYEGQWLVIL